MRTFLFLILAMLFSVAAFAQSVPSTVPVSQPASVSVEDIVIEEAASLPASTSLPTSTSLPASSPASAPVVEDAKGDLLARDLGGKNWSVLAGLVLMALLAVASRFGLREKIGKDNLPLFGAALAIVGAMADSLLNAKGVPLLDAALAGLAAGASATGFWELLRKVMVQKAVEAVAPKSEDGKDKTADAKDSVIASVAEIVANTAVDAAKETVEKKARKPRVSKKAQSNPKEG